jgi:hypothetical protein
MGWQGAKSAVFEVLKSWGFSWGFSWVDSSMFFKRDSDPHTCKKKG